MGIDEKDNEAVMPEGYTWCFRNDEEILAHVTFLYSEYGLCPDDQLTEDAKDLKRKILAMANTLRQPERESCSHVWRGGGSDTFQCVHCAICGAAHPDNWRRG